MHSNRHEQRRNSLNFVQHQIALSHIIPLLEDAGIASLVIKGWSVARLYPTIGHRPCGDLDLCVAPGQLQSTVAILKAMKNSVTQIDLHEGVADLADRNWPQVQSRLQSIPVNGTIVNALGWEDQIRQLAMHLLRHGAWRPQWLKDIAVVLDSLPENFDWDYCLSGDPVRSDWLLCVIGLAHKLLNTKLPTALHSICPTPPQWVVSCLEYQWENNKVGDSHAPLGRDWTRCLHQPWLIPQLIRHRWPNPIEAVFKRGGRPHTRCPKWWYQFALFASRHAQGFRRRKAKAPPMVHVAPVGMKTN